MAVEEVSLTEINDRIAESADQDQPVRMCRLILLHTLRQMSPTRVAQW